MRRRRRARHMGAVGGPRAVGLVALAALAVGTTTPALTAAVAVPATRAQKSTQTPTAFSLTGGPTYSSTLGAVTGVSFSVTPAARRANARVRTTLNPTATWVPCTSSNGGTSWSCDLSGLSIKLLDSGRTFSWVAVA